MQITNSSLVEPGVYQVTVEHEGVYETFKIKPGFAVVSKHHLQKLAYNRMHVYLKERNEEMQAQNAAARAIRTADEASVEETVQEESSVPVLPKGKYKDQPYSEVPTRYLKQIRSRAKGQHKKNIEEELARRDV